MNGRWYINLFILRTTFPAVALEISGKGRASLWRYRESNEETRTDDRDSTESPELSVLCTPPHTHTFSSWLLCLLSQVTLRLDTDSFSTFQLLLTFWRTSTSLGCKSRSPPCCCPRLHLLGITFTNHSLPLGLFFFYTPKTTNCQPTDSSRCDGLTPCENVWKLRRAGGGFKWK